MIDGGYSSVKIASKLGNDLTKMDIYHRWTGYLTFFVRFYRDNIIICPGF
jgi:hypothetical protein